MRRNWASVEFITSKNQRIEKTEKAKSPTRKRFCKLLSSKMNLTWMYLSATWRPTCAQQSPSILSSSLPPKQVSCTWTACCSLAWIEYQTAQGYLGDSALSRSHPETVMPVERDDCIPVSRNILGTVWITSKDSSPKYCLKIGPASVPRSRWHELYPVRTGDSVSPRRIQGATFVCVSNSSGFKGLLYHPNTH